MFQLFFSPLRIEWHIGWFKIYIINKKVQTIPGIIEDPGSFSGSESSPNPHRGPEAKNLMSFAIFIIEQATVLRAPETSTIASWAASASNLLGAVTKGRPVICEIFKIIFFWLIKFKTIDNHRSLMKLTQIIKLTYFRGHFFSETNSSIETSSYCRSSSCQHVHSRKAVLYPLDTKFNLLDISTKFLTKCQWSSILEFRRTGGGE